MPAIGLALGSIKTPDDVARALRDIENFLHSLFPDDAPVSGVAVVVRNSDGGFEQWTVVSAGGCTVTQDAVNKQIKISVP